VFYGRRGYGYSTQIGTGGIWRVDLDTGDSELICSLTEAAKLVGAREGWQWIYHLLVAPDGSRVAAIHAADGGAMPLRHSLITMDIDGSDAFALDHGGMVSHYAWRDPQHILAWSGAGFVLYGDKSSEVGDDGERLHLSRGHAVDPQ